MAAPTFSKNLNMHRRPIQGSIIECEWKRGEGVAAAENVSEKRVHEIVSMVTVGHRAVKPVLRAPLRGFGLDGTMPNGFSSTDVVNVSGTPLSTATRKPPPRRP
jgi:hypothetical protein